MDRRPTPPIQLQQALEIVLAAGTAAVVGAEAVSLGHAQGRVLAEPVTAQADVPAWHSSAMDGYALRAGPAGRTLKIVGEARAGAPADRLPLTAEEACVISTGAAVPLGADAVLELERAEPLPEQQVRPLRIVQQGDNIRRPGEDMRAGEQLLSPGTQLSAAELAVAAGAGRREVRCAKRPRVAILCTGDELQDPGEPLEFGQIHNTNGPALQALATAAGAEVAGFQSGVPDQAAATESRLHSLLESADLVLISGGVSVGPHDHVKPALARLGCEQLFWRLAIKPGKPTWFGRRGRTLVLGLPGNPVSAMVIFMLLGRPLLAAMQGAGEPQPAPLWVVLEHELARDVERTQAARVRLRAAKDGRLMASSTSAAQGSHVTTSLLQADALVLVTPGPEPAGAGERLPAVSIR